MHENMNDEEIPMACSRLTLSNKRQVYVVAQALKFAEESTLRALKPMHQLPEMEEDL